MSATQQLLSVIPFFFLLLASLSEAGSGESVRDVEGKKLLYGAEYYILPSIWARGGGFALASRNGTCPLNVAQEFSEVNNGLPVKFFPAATGGKTVHFGADINVVFSAATICVQSTAWRLLGPDAATQKRYVATGGATGNPGQATISNWFKIEKSGEGSLGYKLVFCPTVCNFCKVVCGNIGVFMEKDKRWVGLTDDPFPVVFKKV
ncbi:hypothetical protein H6P81_017839 [Aristolochia fimbriata]|uniref:Uncharacterized protein n=1 Tax=Aristolochia fimbriata TaxID=158543 RepID=A0AAV7E1A9_ARIFI|nr:hypothetical protein H6P81_017839 [Aristolochia fimbriata]